ncbi:uncharacterized protein SPSK_11014 [Sporothrix schenckii 1099-18]|uniref:Uncharacterized protein n=2 Tax=Sporothrix schenckii TaxID=29908 RepID=U7PWP0_SPOS1|nr:uncharacterized protein SPSK_11014 [Sporothrix schenckii 1099-18]ERT00064.1 hypothetical protein HMPREF1624_03433 [Sporothrix schenckii ATCC 58251]KJR85504.1 hypothetical protein SPSK_11014 [Sporothrix schenckii 1099-18]
MGCVLSCIEGICQAIGSVLIGIANAIGAIIMFIVDGVIAIFDIIIGCLTCQGFRGRGLRRRRRVHSAV